MVITASTKKHLTFRSQELVYYGPFQCEYCGVTICRMAKDQGGNSFTYPDGPIYPNTIWESHICNPAAVLAMRVKRAKEVVQARFPKAVPYEYKDRDHWAILQGPGGLAIGRQEVWCTTEDDAWLYAADEAMPPASAGCELSNAKSG